MARVEKTAHQISAEKNYDSYNYKSMSLNKENAWMDIFYGKIKFDLKNVSPQYKFKYAAYSGLEYYIRVIEVTKGKKKGGETWLSKVTKETIGDALAGYTNAIIKLDAYTSELLTKTTFVIEDKVQDLGSWLWGKLYYDENKRPCHNAQHKTKYLFSYTNGLARDVGDSAFPDLYMPDPKIPSRYKKFNPDFIFPGERYVILIPLDALSNPTVQIPNTFWAGAWIGLVLNGSFTYKIAGLDARIGIIFQLSALWEKTASYNLAIISGVGGHVGVGIGGHVDANILFILNAQQAAQIEGFEWGFDWDLVFGSLSAKSITKSTQIIYDSLRTIFKKGGILSVASRLGAGKKNTKYLINHKTLKGLAKNIKLLGSSTLKSNIEMLLKNTLANLQSQMMGGGVITIQYPIPSASLGKHIFAGLRGIKTWILAQWNLNPKTGNVTEIAYGNESIRVAINDATSFEIIDEIKYDQLV